MRQRDSLFPTARISKGIGSADIKCVDMTCPHRMYCGRNSAQVTDSSFKPQLRVWIESPKYGKLRVQCDSYNVVAVAVEVVEIDSTTRRKKEQ